MNRQSDPTGARLAPHVEPSWVEGLILELRLQGVSGQAIGAALSEVEAHVVDSGESAQEAFGDAAGYARRLALPVSADQTTEATLLLGTPVLAQVLGLMILAPTSGSTTGAVSWTWGFVLGVGILVAGVAALFAWSGSILRAGVRKPVFAAILAVAVVLATPLLLIALPATAISTPAWVGWAFGGGLLVAGTLAMLVRRNAGDDPIQGPWTSRPATGMAARVLRALAVPVVALVVVVLGLAMGSGLLR